MSGPIQIVSLEPGHLESLRGGEVYSHAGVLVVPESRRAEVEEVIGGRSLSPETHVVYVDESDLARLEGATEERPVVRTDDPAVLLCARAVDEQIVRALQAEGWMTLSILGQPERGNR